MSMTDAEKIALARTLSEKSPWMNRNTAKHLIDILDGEGVIRNRGREVLPGEIPKGATARVEYDVLTKNHMTGEFVTTRHMEVTSRKVPDPTAGSMVHQKVANVRYFVVEEPKTMREKLTEAFEAAPGCLTDRGLAEYLLSRFDVAEKAAKQAKTIRSHGGGSAVEPMETEDEYRKRIAPVYGPEVWRGRSE